MLVHEISGIAPDVIPTRDAFRRYIQANPRSLLTAKFWDICTDIDALFDRLGGSHVRAAFVLAYKHHDGWNSDTALLYRLSSFILGWYGLYEVESWWEKTEIYHCRRPRVKNCAHAIKNSTAQINHTRLGFAKTAFRRDAA